MTAQNDITPLNDNYILSNGKELKEALSSSFPNLILLRKISGFDVRCPTYYSPFEHEPIVSNDLIVELYPSSHKSTKAEYIASPFPNDTFFIADLTKVINDNVEIFNHYNFERDSCVSWENSVMIRSPKGLKVYVTFMSEDSTLLFKFYDPKTKRDDLEDIKVSFADKLVTEIEMNGVEIIIQKNNYSYFCDKIIIDGNSYSFILGKYMNISYIESVILPDK